MRTNKVVWSEGLFLRPQIFQQQERYLEYYIHRRACSSGIFFWGFSHYEIDSEALTYGKLVLRCASGVFPDGTPFDIPGHAALPSPLTLLPEHPGRTLYLAVPLRLENSEETIFNSHDPASLARFCATDAEINDSNAIRQGSKLVQLASLRLSLRSESEMNESWIGLPVARVKAINTDGSVLLHTEDDIPPVTQWGASHLLSGWLNHLCGLINIRADMLAARLTSADRKIASGAEVIDYLLLQLLNNYQVQFESLKNIPESSPVVFYQIMATLVAELSTYLRPHERRPQALPVYQHSQIYLSLRPLVTEIHDLLNQVLVRSGEQIELVSRGKGIWTATLLPAELAAFSTVVLAVHADISPDVLLQQFLSQTKLSAPQQLHELVRSHLPGLLLQALPVPPRQIPFRAGYVYFELQQQGDFWRNITGSGALALHVAGDFPGLEMELWGVRKS